MDYKEWEKRYMKDIKERSEKLKAMTLREMLVLLAGEKDMPDNSTRFDNILPRSSCKVNICFMPEPDTWINTYATHPILIPWYGCPVESIQVGTEYTLDIWIRFEGFLEKGNRSEAWSEDHKKPES